MSPVKDALMRLRQSVDDVASLEPGGARLLALRNVQVALDAEFRAEVMHMRRRHGSWDDVGRLLGITRQAAWARFNASRADTRGERS